MVCALTVRGIDRTVPLGTAKASMSTETIRQYMVRKLTCQLSWIKRVTAGGFSLARVPWWLRALVKMAVGGGRGAQSGQDGQMTIVCYARRW
jgi:hypothetical protein